MPQKRAITPLHAAVERTVHRYSALYLTHSTAILRLALGLVYAWFGILKFVGSASPAAGLATSTMSAMTFHLVPAGVSLPLLAALETLIGLGFLSGLLPRLTAAAFLVQVVGALSSTVLASHQIWVHAPLEPTIVGQYVIKDLILLAGGLLVVTAPRRPRRETSPGPLHSLPGTAEDPL